MIKNVYFFILNKKQIVFKVHKQDFIFCAAIGFALLWDMIFGCPTQFLTGISCPGCGMSRAAISLIHLDYSQAFYYNPCVFILPLAVILYFFRNKIENVKLKRCLLILFFIVYISVYIYRLRIENQVIKNDIRNGVIYKLLVILKKE